MKRSMGKSDFLKTYSYVTYVLQYFYHIKESADDHMLAFGYKELCKVGATSFAKLGREILCYI